MHAVITRLITINSCPWNGHLNSTAEKESTSAAREARSPGSSQPHMFLPSYLGFLQSILCRAANYLFKVEISSCQSPVYNLRASLSVLLPKPQILICPHSISSPLFYFFSLDSGHCGLPSVPCMTSFIHSHSTKLPTIVPGTMCQMQL